MPEDEVPEGGRRRRGWGQLALFLRPAILLLLRQDPAHGYNLIEGLRQQGMIDPDLDPGVVYRYLREMEEEGLLSSAWEMEGSGVPRRVYHLTLEGEAFARGCITNLRRTQQRLEHLLELYAQHFPEETVE